jgi:uncharacterized protein (DUF885 family)
MRRRAAVLDGLELVESDRISLELLAQEIDAEIGRLDMDLDAWSVDPISGPHVEILELAKVQPTADARQREALVERWTSAGNYVRAATRELRRGKRQGLTASRTAVEKSIAQLEAILATHPMDSPLVAVATGGGRWVELKPGQSVSAIAHEELGDARFQRELRLVNRHLLDSPREAVGTRVLLPAHDDPLSAQARGEFLHAVLRAVEDEIYPAFNAYRELLADEILPAARSDASAGLTHIAGGAEIYRKLIQEHCTLPAQECDPQRLHALGLESLARLREEIVELGASQFGTTELAEIRRRLREDPELRFATSGEIVAEAAQTLTQARSNLYKLVGVQPEADCTTVAMPFAGKRRALSAAYQPPPRDGSRPGRYLVDSSRPQDLPRYQLQAITFHQAIPGRHLQAALAQELENLPLFRRHGGSTAFVEGWALYAAQLCDELGLYGSELDRLGLLALDAWYTSLLVVDTGIHGFGWSRAKAIAYLLENTFLERELAEREVDRCIAHPGRALADKVGQRVLLELRDEARGTLGARFDYRQYHDRLLEHGAVSLSTLRGIVRRWLESPSSE